MQKRVLILAVLALLVFTISSISLVSFVSADRIDDAYNCLNGIVNRTSSLPLQESVFSVLALGELESPTRSIENQEYTSLHCWPRAGCKIKDTAQALLAYWRIGRDTTATETWLFSQKGITNQLTWYLEIDIEDHKAAECSIFYDNAEQKVNINDDLTLSGSVGGCLSITPSKYWLQISPSCLEKDFDVKCNKDFITSLLYKKQGTDTIYVSSQSSSEVAGRFTRESINGRCLKTNNVCDYEGTMWAALALDSADNDVSEFIPYLIALEDDYPQYFPAAALYFFTGSDEHYTKIIDSQRLVGFEKGFWDVGTIADPYDEYYDTSFALTFLAGSAGREETEARNYLLSKQDPNGCWKSNNVLTTAFILWSAWPRNPYIAPPKICGDGIPGNTAGEECDDGNNNKRDACIIDSYNNYECKDAYCGDGYIWDAEGTCTGADCEQCDDKDTDNSDACTNYCRLNVCGDGFIYEFHEKCDDGNTVSGDGCSASCVREQFQPNLCGNGIPNPGEQCDDGNFISGDGCSSTCRDESVRPICGNGNPEPPLEECDDGNVRNGDGCDYMCRDEDDSGPVCGNGDEEAGEQCEDGNTRNGDGCSSTCTNEIPIPNCGNGIRNFGEQCDDGCLRGTPRVCEAIDNGDGCSSICMSENLLPVCGNGFLESGEYCEDGCISPNNPIGCDSLPLSNGDGCSTLCRIEGGSGGGVGTPVCGNEIHEAGEQCDDGNDRNGDGCSRLCAIEIVARGCGNGIREFGEQCDDGNNLNGDGCSALCAIESQNLICGNNYLDSGEQCDDGNNRNNDGCSSTCRTEIASPICGNRIIETGETCDDGNKINEDGCSASCSLEVVTPGCGNGIREFGEQCDDGNRASGDGCSASCLNEYTYSICGNYLLEQGETCDDGNRVSGDGCSNTCRIESPAGAVCGNGIHEAGEQCDDGNKINGDGCDKSCKLEFIYAFCGNKIIETGEQCDDGNNLNGDGCSSLCRLEGTAPYCGDGVVHTLFNEKCDDGNKINGDGCSSNCQIEIPPAKCGDGITGNSAGEECDDGNKINGDGCSSNCQIEVVLPICGNGINEAGEQCDDGNHLNGDGCSALCRVEIPGGGGVAVCGNGVRESGESCDDGNRHDGDGCSYYCQIEVVPSKCGNGVHEAGEQCDDGNNLNGDGCANNCKIEVIPAQCGDGNIDGQLGETCDDGNRISGDGCSYRCKLEPLSSSCGNGLNEAGEECDDGNNINDDGCSNICIINIIPEGCGNGIWEAGEQCDDGNNINDDRCSANCEIEFDVPSCGNGFHEAGEQCDDGNNINGDGCSAECRIEFPGNGEAYIIVSPVSVNYGNIVVNESSTGAVITIANGVSDALLSVSDIVLSDNENFEIYFDVGNVPCRSSSPIISSLGICHFGIKFTPKTGGESIGDVAIYSNAINEPVFVASLKGNGTAPSDDQPTQECKITLFRPSGGCPSGYDCIDGFCVPEPTPEMSVFPLSWSFGLIDIGRNSTNLEVRIRNTGEANLEVDSMLLSGTDFELNVDFGNNACKKTDPVIAKDKTCSVGVRFGPSNEGLKEENLTIISDDPDKPSVSVQLAGIGVSGGTLPPIIPGPNQTGGAGGGGGLGCQSSGYFCERASECANSGASILYEYDCSEFGGFVFCCSQAVQELTCNEKGGRVCAGNERCSGSSTPTADGSCCLGTCNVIEVENTCELFGGTCRTSCFSDETESGENCEEFGDVCCQQSFTPSGGGTGVSSWVWIILLIVLILIIVLGIIYRDRIKLWVYKMRGKAGSKPVTRPSTFGPGQSPQLIRPQPRPMFGGFPVRRPMIRPVQPRPQPQIRPQPKPTQPEPKPKPLAKKKSSSDSEMEETLRKLKEISKGK